MVDIQLIKSDGLARVEGKVPKGVFKEAYDSFLSASERAGETSSFQLVIGGQRIELNFAGKALINSFLPALRHLLSPNNSVPDLRLFLWDFESTQVQLPKSILDSHIYEDALFSDPRLMQLLDIEQSMGIYWVSKASSIPYYEQGSPFRAIFQWWMKPHQMRIVHAGAVGIGPNGVLLAGSGGSGKSTTTLACINAGFSYLGDDNCLVALDPVPKIYSLYNTLKLNWDNVKNFDNLPAALSNSSGVQIEKALFFLDEYKSESLKDSLNLEAILMPTIVDRVGTRIVRSSTINALKVIGPSTIFQSPTDGQDLIKFLSKLVKTVPVYTLELGSDLAGVSDTLRNFVSRPEVK